MESKISPALMERIDAGIEWANEDIPDWREYVNPNKIDMSDETTCFLGQYWESKYGDGAFWSAAGALFPYDWELLKTLGFISDGESYRELTAAWRQKFIELGLLDNEQKS